MADLDPLSGPVVRTVAPAPLQGQPTSGTEGAFGAFTASGFSTLGASLIAKSIPGSADNQFISHDDAAKQFTDAGLNPDVIPKDGIYQSGLNAIKEQQTIVNNASDAAARSSGAGGVGQFVAGLAGGLTDPIFLALGPVGRVAEATGAALGIAKGASLAARAATGAAEGGAVMGGYTEAEKKFGTAPGDPDITSYNVLKQTGIGMAFGGVTKAALGARPVDTDTVAKLEKSDVVAKQLKISPNDVVSPTGAIGVHQIEPSTAKSVMGKDFDVSTLHDPEVNKMVAQKVLEENNKHFPGDEEAQVIAYNAGPGRAKAWIDAGRNDSVLPAETQKYVQAYRNIRDQNPLKQAAALPPETQDAAMKTAVASLASDSVVNVDPVIQNAKLEDTFTTNPAKIANEHESEMASILGGAPPAPLADALPRPGSATVNERLSSDMLEQVNNAVAEAKPLPVEGETNPELADVKAQSADAVKEAMDAHKQAFGEPEEGQEHPVKVLLASAEEGDKDTDRLSKGVDAAVRCGAMKGID